MLVLETSAVAGLAAAETLAATAADWRYLSLSVMIL